MTPATRQKAPPTDWESQVNSQNAPESEQGLKQTPLDALHRELGGKMVPFAGFDMPVQYEAGILKEHLHTREAAAVFDVSHMGQAFLRGDNVQAALETLVPGELQALKEGRTRYTLLTNEAGGILDDLMVTNRGDYLYLVVNAACKEADFAHIEDRIGAETELEILEDRALIALQGPAAAAVLSRHASGVDTMAFMSAATVDIAGVSGGVSCFVTRSGYTGEDGYEISAPAADAEALTRLLLDEAEVAPAGLGARDTLRLEAGLCLYGSDIDTQTTPIEAGLAWAVNKRRREEGGFPGDGIILAQLKDGVTKKRVGIKPEGKAPARAHTPIEDSGGNAIGEITSGGYGPSVGGPIAMGYVDAAFSDPDTPVNLMVRGKALAAKVAKLPFVEQRYYKS
ncbi:MAG TPA: glycine cleavage system aminomethyltransferase GcvT [Rhodospirillales bacterium]|jgi:aminomethyltransferase|nr:glycine cleavage system aminomethyltransferase GcvT [Rhodospirillales bacterium]